ncbi:hypothetical protein [Ferroplasma sp.]|uniref:hypothetical protein n=1 Tax=Ferroplasma sp. TaxID=2591003 RepID=UPI00307DEB73
MNEDFAKLKSYADYIEFPFKVDGLDSRILIQKMAYILENMGMNLHYYFTWWRHGPYSPPLANDYYEWSRGDNNIANVPINEGEKQGLDLFKNIVDANIPLLEAIATLMYKNYVYRDLNEVLTLTKKLKPHPDDGIIIKAQNKAKELLFKPEYLTEELKKEINEWQQFD